MCHGGKKKKTLSQLGLGLFLEHDEAVADDHDIALFHLGNKDDVLVTGRSAANLPHVSLERICELIKNIKGEPEKAEINIAQIATYLLQSGHPL